MMLDRRRLSLGIAAAGFSAIAPPLAAQQRVVRLIVPAAPGGAIDVIGRLYAQRLSELLGQTWVVENKSGASNTLGAAEVADYGPPRHAERVLRPDRRLHTDLAFRDFADGPHR
jgi:tripartite-type tricarboxylate transporter receptor subunit TctC